MEFSILYWLQGLHGPVLDRLMTAVTFLGNGGWFWIVLGLVLLAGKRTRKVGLAVLLSLLGGLIIGNVFLKNLVCRSRPCWLDPSVPLLISSPHDFSFPSGHTLASFEGAVSVWLYHRRWGTVLLVLAAVIGFSRLYLFVHFPTDVLAGAVLGTLIAVTVHWVLERRCGAREKADGKSCST